MTDIPYTPKPYRYVMAWMAALSTAVGWSPRLYLEPLVEHLKGRSPMESDA